MAAIQETQQPLLESDHHNDNTSFGNNIVAAASAAIAPEKQSKTPAQKAIRKTFKGTAHLSNLLPTGSVLVFQTLSPAFTRQGKCPTAANHTMTTLLLALCSLTCFLLCFTDSWRDERGKVRYGLATFRGLWIIDGSKVAVPAEEAANYRLRLIDFLHALMSVLVFAAVALIDQNVVNCFYPNPSEEGKQLLAAFPVGIAIVCSILFLLLPTKRHGIGFPLSRS